MSSNPRITEAFIETYRNEKCLWEMTSTEYRDKALRHAAYVKLQEILKTTDPNATKDDVIKKIHNIRSTYRKEYKRVKESMKSGCSPDDVYKPRLWYFSMLGFLDDQDVPRQSHSNLEDDVEGRNEELETSEFDESNEASWTASVAGGSKTSQPKRSREDDENQLKNDVLRSVKRHFDKALNEKEDRFDIFGKSVALKLRDLEDEQRIIAEKIINDTLFEAEMGNLKWPGLYYPQVPLNFQQPFPYSSAFAWNVACNPPVSSASSNVDSDDK